MQGEDASDQSTFARFWAKPVTSSSPLKKLHLMFTAPDRFHEPMRIADVTAFYTPFGGGVRTYVEAKLRAAARFGHEMIIIAPGESHQVIKRGPGAFLVTIPSPRLPVDRRYRYFDDERLLHSTLDAWQPDHVEASSPWSSATMVGRWQGAATRSLFMHADPLATYAYRWLGGIAPRDTIDRLFGRFWRHLRGLGNMFDTIVCANTDLARRLSDGGLANAETIRMGVEPGLFSPSLRSAELRRAALAALGLDPEALLLLGIGRFSAEKRWELVLRAAGECGRKLPVGLLLVGDGRTRQKLERIGEQYRNVAVLPQITDRSELASLLASSDALVHGCESETFCLVAAEARASGVPLIVPDGGGAADQLVEGAGTTYASGREQSLEKAVERFLYRGPELQRAAAVRASYPRTMDEHFADLFARYQALAAEHVVAPAALAVGGAAPVFEPIPEVALARSPLRLH
jgi:alpha-1,6-mannosyltransferase